MCAKWHCLCFSKDEFVLRPRSKHCSTQVIKSNLYQQVQVLHFCNFFSIILWNELAEFSAEFSHVRSCYRKFKRLGSGEVRSYISQIICHIKSLSWILPGFRSIFITDTHFLIPLSWKEYYHQHMYFSYPHNVETSGILSHFFLLIHYAESCQNHKKKKLMGAGGQEDSRIPGLFFLPERSHGWDIALSPIVHFRFTGRL